MDHHFSTTLKYGRLGVRKGVPTIVVTRNKNSPLIMGTDSEMEYELNNDGMYLYGDKVVFKGSDISIESSSTVDSTLLITGSDGDRKMVVSNDGIIISDENVTEKSNTALLHLQSKKRGLLLSRLTNDEINSMNTVGVLPGTIIYNSDSDEFLGMTRRYGWVSLSNNRCSRLKIVSNDKKADIKPIAGTIIYNRDHKAIEVYAGKQWKTIKLT